MTCIIALYCIVIAFSVIINDLFRITYQ